MALFIEFLSLALKPAKLSCQILARTVCIVIETWHEVLKFAVSVHFIILWRLLVSAFALFSFPFRAYSALSRERMLETQIYRLRNEVGNLMWDRNDLQERLHAAVSERNMIETMLMELEQEHDEAVAKADTLHREVRVLKVEIQRLKEVQGKSLSSLDGRDHPISTTDEISRNTTKQLSKNPRTDEIHVIGPKSYGLSLQPHAISNEREVALSRTLFSATLSIVVGIVVWGAENPCMPLVVALFTVVVMSLKSVIRFYTRIEHGAPRYDDAIVLLSFNWFMLGTLSYAMMPVVVRFLAPLTLAFVKWGF